MILFQMNAVILKFSKILKSDSKFQKNNIYLK